jgi:hypothetical protein
MKNKKLILYAIQKGKGYTPKDYNWNYCIEHNIPYIIIHPKIKFASIEYDLLPVDFGLTFPADHNFHNRWLIYYDKYRINTHLPDTQYSFIGGPISGIFTIWKKDSANVVSELISLIDTQVKEFGLIDPVQKEHTETLTRMNKMMN